jgi:hypothetical protein
LVTTPPAYNAFHRKALLSDQVQDDIEAQIEIFEAYLSRLMTYQVWRRCTSWPQVCQDGDKKTYIMTEIGVSLIPWY